MSLCTSYLSRQALRHISSHCPSTSSARAAYATTPYRLALRAKYAEPSPMHFVSDSDSGNILSPWHEIPLYVPSAGGGSAAPGGGSPAVYMVATIPRHSTAALRLALELPYNPLVQERAQGGREERFLGLRAPANMGELPQTYEDAGVVDPHTGLRGSGTTLSVLEIGSSQQPAGSVCSVRVLGALALVEGNATAWKILTVSESDPLASRASCILTDAPLPVLKLAQDLAQWLQLVRVTEGGAAAHVAQPGSSSSSSSSSAWVGREEALRVLQRSHQQWRRLVEEGRAQGSTGMYAGGGSGSSSSSISTLASRPWVLPVEGSKEGLR